MINRGSEKMSVGRDRRRAKSIASVKRIRTARTKTGGRAGRDRGSEGEGEGRGREDENTRACGCCEARIQAVVDKNTT